MASSRLKSSYNFVSSFVLGHFFHREISWFWFTMDLGPMGVFLKWLYVLVFQSLLGYNKKRRNNTTSLVTFPLKSREHGGSLSPYWEKLLTHPRHVYFFFKIVGTDQLYDIAMDAKRSTVGKNAFSSEGMSSVFIAQHMQRHLNKKRNQWTWLLKACLWQGLHLFSEHVIL